MTKKQAQQVLEQMPQNFHIDQLIEKLLFIENIEEGLQDIKMQDVKTHDEVVRFFEAYKTL